ncbi:hypothetical protein E1287_37585, partial [Actinomadura sp. KC06]|uniref:hypothetical protein n=1 Tax=Actinomadura sp. KC06 TaxID=2530369 RepID=UPI0010F3D63C
PAQGQSPADPPAEPAKNDPPADPPKPDGDTTDWKAQARKWEQRAKDNGKAAAELEKLKASQMTEQEKAVSAAEKQGRTAAALDYGKRLAAAELRAAAATKGVDLSVIGDLIDTSKFVDDAGDVDTDAIKKAVDKLAKTKGAGRGSGDFPGGTGAGQPITEEQFARMTPEEITEAHAAGKLNHLL